MPEDSGQNVELDYLKLLDWTGRQFQADKRGVIPATCAPIPHRLDCSEETWFDLVRNEAGSVLSVRAVGNGCATHHRFTLPGRRTKSNQTVGDGWHNLRLIPAIFVSLRVFVASKTRAARGLFSSHKETQEDTKCTNNVWEHASQIVRFADRGVSSTFCSRYSFVLQLISDSG